MVCELYLIKKKNSSFLVRRKSEIWQTNASANKISFLTKSLFLEQILAPKTLPSTW